LGAQPAADRRCSAPDGGNRDGTEALLAHLCNNTAKLLMCDQCFPWLEAGNGGFCRRMERPGDAREQPKPDVLLEPQEKGSHRTPAHAECRGDAGDGAVLDHGTERLQLADIEHFNLIGL
jgi:hypothetical protein